MECLYFLFSSDVNIKLLQIYIYIYIYLYIHIHIYPWVKDIKDFSITVLSCQELKSHHCILKNK